MNSDEMIKKSHIKNNWRAHISNYIKLKKQKKDYSTENYCKQENINHQAFKAWLKHIEKEDEYVFHMSFATEYINRAKRALDLFRKYKDTSELSMPLLRYAIVSYTAPFTESFGRVSNTLHLKKILSLTL